MKLLTKSGGNDSQNPSETEPTVQDEPQVEEDLPPEEDGAVPIEEDLGSDYQEPDIYEDIPPDEDIDEDTDYEGGI